MTKISQKLAAALIAMVILVLFVSAVAVAILGQDRGWAAPTPPPNTPPYVYVEVCETNTVAETYALGTAAQIIANEGCTDIHIRRIDDTYWQVHGTKTIVVTN